MILTHSLIKVCVLDYFIRFSFNIALSLFGTSNDDLVRVHCNLCCFCSLLSSLHGLDLLAKTAKKHHSLHGVALLRSDCVVTVSLILSVCLSNMAHCSKVGIYTASILAVQCFQISVLNDSHA